MALYVLAFTDSEVRRRSGRTPLVNIEVQGICAVCRRRSVLPPPTDEILRRQHQEVLAIARRARAVLPVRFGGLIEKHELVERMREHAEGLQRALDDVRDRVQMTLRIPGTPPPTATIGVSSGRGYLEERRRALEPVLPEDVRLFVELLSSLAVRERREPGVAGLLATIYHLVPVANVASYAAAASRHSVSSTIVSGPWPPFAFTPQLW